MDRYNDRDKYMKMLYDNDKHNIDDIYNVFDTVLKKHNDDQQASSFSYSRKLLSTDQSHNLLENITGSFAFDTAASSGYGISYDFPKTATQEKILYKKPANTIKNNMSYESYTGNPQTVSSQNHHPVHIPSSYHTDHNQNFGKISHVYANNPVSLGNSITYNTHKYTN